MGKAVGGIFFIGLFIVFLIVKYAFTGAKAAYEAVFDPQAKDDRIRTLIENCMLRVSNAMHEKYNGDESGLSLAILHLTPMVQSAIMEAGYNVPAAVARSIVCDAIVNGKHASRSQVNEALARA